MNKKVVIIIVVLLLGVAVWYFFIKKKKQNVTKIIPNPSIIPAPTGQYEQSFDVAHGSEFL